MGNRKNRVLLISSITYVLIGLLVLLIKEDLYHLFSFEPSILLVSAITLMLGGISIFLMLYVRGAIFPSSIITDEKYEYVSDKSSIDEKFELLKTELYSKVADFKNIDEVKKEIRTSINQQVSKLSEEKIVQQISSKFSNELYTKSKLDLIENELASIKFRIERETARLARYGYINLMIGFITTFLAIFFLGYSLLGVQTQNTTPAEYIYHFMPRLSLSVLIELFSFFFLRLYKNNLEDIKYFNNERTNIEMKIVAIKTSLLYDDREMVKSLMLELAMTERNFVLKKGESTVEIEKNRADTSSNDKLLGGIIKILDRK
ncbi:hypothetical protein E6C50_01925 [Flavobacterium supellecticarium]|uniref:Uncharacterized protein n=1 Tax=Flavobacterium supellecticarium TaxID=2565924 RepID=A0A4S4A3H6_9FLAO|nr:hypothetical protein [Flavobacterium supellecticarium]THF52989.1 hypothetical protein E6C50_01925 [Flavobacterium supellecticarium]